MICFEDIYNLSIKTSRNLIEDIRFNRNINLKPSISCIEQICHYLYTNTNVLNVLNSVQDKNPYMISHPVHVAFLSFTIGKWMNLNNAELSNLTLSGFLHDIGKAKIKDSLLNRQDKLNDLEMAKMRSHPTMGYKILEHISDVNQEVIFGVICHHERMDGYGYPMGLKGDRISLFGRIIAIADIYDAITATRAYQTKKSPFKAVEEIQACSFGSLDPKICQIFIDNIINYYYGSKVRLNNQLEGEIIYVNPEEKTKPLIRCKDEFVNLSKERLLEIVDIL